MFLLISGFGAANIIDKNIINSNIKTNIKFNFQPNFIDYGEYITIDIEGSNGFINDPGKPKLPVYRKIYEFSKNEEIIDIKVKIGETKEEMIHKKIIPCFQSIPLNYESHNIDYEVLVEDEKIYHNQNLYPYNWYNYKIRCGLNDENIQTTFLIIDIYPIRYNPYNNIIEYINSADLEIKHQNPINKKSILNYESYDLIIICPEDFQNDLNRLAEHKNNLGVKTFIKTIEEILSNYNGRDEPEQIKYFLKEAKEEFGNTYVLLVGGLKSYLYSNDKDDQNHGSTKGWNVPVRYTNIKHSNEVGVISDLYYSDLYKYNETSYEWEFESWDSNEDDIFANGQPFYKDDLDLIPDIYVGRLACRNKIDLNIIIDKIITYESSSPNDKPWMRKMIGIGGRTFDMYNGEDQRQQYVDDFINISGGEWQEFMTRNSKLSRVEVFIQKWTDLDTSLELSIQKPFGNVISSYEISSDLVSDDKHSWVSFDITDVELEIGEKYYIVLSTPVENSFSWCFGERNPLGIDRYIYGNSSLGDGFDWCFKTYDLNEGEDEADGEYSVDAAFDFMEGKIDEEVRIYWSNEGTNDPIPETEDIVNAFNEGAGFVIMEGHGNPLSWATHPIPPGSPFRGGVSITDFPDIRNGDKLPIVVVGGCHNALFNVSLIRTLIGRPYDNWYWTSGYITPICFCWALCASPVGGAIASTGCTGLGLGGNPPHLINSGGLDCNFFYEIGTGSEFLGQAHSGAIRKYIIENTLNSEEEFCIVEFHLFGDPSLKIGGY
jgi:hypothetical protein